MRVLLAEPQPIFHLGLNQLLEDLAETAEFIETDDLKEICPLAKDAGLDLTLIHIRLPGIAPPDGLAAMVRMMPEKLVIVVSTLGSRAMEMLNQGLIAARAAGQIAAFRYAEA